MINIKLFHIHLHWYIYYQPFLDMCYKLVDDSLYYFYIKGLINCIEDPWKLWLLVFENLDLQVHIKHLEFNFWFLLLSKKIDQTKFSVILTFYQDS